jgi:hypothetical protein
VNSVVLGSCFCGARVFLEGKCVVARLTITRIRSVVLEFHDGNGAFAEHSIIEYLGITPLGVRFYVIEARCGRIKLTTVIEA